MAAISSMYIAYTCILYMYVRHWYFHISTFFAQVTTASKKFPYLNRVPTKSW